MTTDFRDAVDEENAKLRELAKEMLPEGKWGDHAPIWVPTAWSRLSSGHVMGKISPGSASLVPTSDELADWLDWQVHLCTEALVATKEAMGTPLGEVRERWIANRVAKHMEQPKPWDPDIVRILASEEPKGWLQDGEGIQPYYSDYVPEGRTAVAPTYEGKLEYYERTVDGQKEETNQK